MATSCANKTAIRDLYGHGTACASISLTSTAWASPASPPRRPWWPSRCGRGFCAADSVGRLRYAGDQRLDVVNMSLFADPFLYYCRNEAEQRAILKELQSAARYAWQRGVLLVASAGNEADDLHTPVDEISPDYPPDSAETRRVRNNCRVAPAELPGVVAVSATGPVGYPGYHQHRRVLLGRHGRGRRPPVAAASRPPTPSRTAVLGVLNAPPSVLWDAFDPLEPDLPGITVVDQGRAMASRTAPRWRPPSAGVAALIRQVHPEWSQGGRGRAGALGHAGLPSGLRPIDEDDDRQRCCNSANRNSFFGAGMVNAARAAAL